MEKAPVNGTQAVRWRIV